jgi:hypothetical protein
MKILAILIDLICITAIVVLIMTSDKGFEFKNDYYPILLFSLIAVLFFNIKAFKSNAKK